MTSPNSYLQLLTDGGFTMDGTRYFSGSDPYAYAAPYLAADASNIPPEFDYYHVALGRLGVAFAGMGSASNGADPSTVSTADIIAYNRARSDNPNLPEPTKENVAAWLTMGTGNASNASPTLEASSPVGTPPIADTSGGNSWLKSKWLDYFPVLPGVSAGDVGYTVQTKGMNILLILIGVILIAFAAYSVIAPPGTAKAVLLKTAKSVVA